MTAEGGGEKSRFRWLDAVRYAVAAAVTVLIMAVIVNAIKVVLRPESLQLFVSRGSVFTRQYSPPPEELLAFSLELRAQNPSGRVGMYYTSITVYLFDNKTSAASLDPTFDCIVYFPMKDMAVLQQDMVEDSMEAKLNKGLVDSSYFDMLYNGSSFSDMTLRLDGNLITEVTSVFNKTRRTTYYCQQILFGGNSDDEAFKYRKDVIWKGLN